MSPGTITRQPGHIIDVLPTCLEVAGAQYPTQFAGRAILPVEGKSLLPIFRGDQREPHAQLCWEWAGNAAIRQGPWKLVWDKLVKRWELYHLDTDRTETQDLAVEHPELVAQLAAAYDQWAIATGNRRIGAPAADVEKQSPGS